VPINNPSSHNDLISIVVNLANLGGGGVSFTGLAIAVADVTPNGGRFKTYSSYQDVEDDTANLNAIALRMAYVAFGQAKKPATVTIIGVAVIASSESYPTAIDDAIANGAEFYGLLIDSRTASDIIAVANHFETLAVSDTFLLFGMQDDDADWLTTGIPAAYSAIEGNERTVCYYHDSNTNDSTSARLDVAAFADRLSWDVDKYAPAWNAPVVEVAALQTALTQTQKEYARANFANTALPFGTNTDTFVDPGKTLAGRPVDHLVASDWLRQRIKEAVADLMVAVAAKGKKIAVDETGQALVGSKIDAVINRGIVIGHFSQYRLDFLEITSADILEQLLQFDSEIQQASSLRKVNITLNFTTEDIEEA